MAVDQFLHGAEVVDIDDGVRAFQTVATSIIGIVGTAPRADDTVFPLNTPVMVAGSRSKAAKLLSADATEAGDGTLPAALDLIFDQVGAAVVVVRVEQGEDDAETLANILGGVNSGTGQFEGVHALVAAESITGFKPRILCVPGFTHQRVAGGVVSLAGNAGSGYTAGTYALSASGGGGSGFAGTVTIGPSGSITARTITSPGSSYETAPTLSFTGAGSGTGGTVTASVGLVGNAVVAELVGIADRMRAVIIADGPSTTDDDAIAYAGDFGSRRVYVVDPSVLRYNADAELETTHASAAVAGVIARTDNDEGWWVSPSNHVINGIVGTARAIDFALGDRNARANLLNEQNVATIIRQNGFRLWGNRTLSADPKWTFLSVVRTADILADTLLVNHLWAVDRGITKNYVQDVQDGVNAYLRQLKAQGAILGGKCYVDPDLNTPEAIAQGKVYFDFDFTPAYPAEHITFRSHLVTDYIAEIF